MMFTEDQLDMIQNNVREVTEVYVETRKDVPQTRYVFEVTQSKYYCTSAQDYLDIPSSMTGLWMQKFPEDNTAAYLKDRLGLTSFNSYRCDWVKCKAEEHVVTKYVQEDR